eukprot:TRINITY_DN2966_c0_g2_i2.p1 TRINITY_DN2966_c0_g2~~TRINITY_DN2966_c0_g2_i2.p1  ORF type:complete len:362 (-),score=122.16 TRINITY_DN2966_c0_g2_i2:149-1234(-)
MYFCEVTKSQWSNPFNPDEDNSVEESTPIEDMENIENLELRGKVQEFAIRIYKSRSKCIEKPDRRRLTSIAEYMYENFCAPEPVYENVAKVLDIHVDKVKDKLLNYYWTCIDNKEKKAVFPIVRRVSACITDTSAEFIRSANLFDGERSALKGALEKIKELEERKKLPQLQLLKRKKLEDADTPEEILKTKLVSQILLQINQRTNTPLQEELNKEAEKMIKSLDGLPAISDVLQELASSPFSILDRHIVISSEGQEESKHSHRPSELFQHSERTVDAGLDRALSNIAERRRSVNGGKVAGKSARSVVGGEAFSGKEMKGRLNEMVDNLVIGEKPIRKEYPIATPKIRINGPRYGSEFPGIM